MSRRGLEVLAPGPLCLVEDLGRAGWASLGVPRSGAFDRGAARLAQRLVGNPDDAALLEITLGGFRARLTAAVTFALTGADCAATLTPPGPAARPRPVPWGEPVSAAAGSLLRLGTASDGVRAYLAVRGGLDVPAELGSCSTDLLGGLGPAPVAAGDVLAVGTRTTGPPAARGGLRPHPTTGTRTLVVHPGPRLDRFAPGTLATLLTTVWTVRADSDRIGLRLDGPALRRRHDDELPSEPTLPGAVQVPPDGRPILFGPDAPVTGGYPVIAVADAGALDGAAQLRPGDTVRLALAGRGAPPTTGDRATARDQPTSGSSTV